MAEKKKILVVEDFDDARQLLALFIRRFGYEAFEAVDGIEALEQAAAVHPDLILMDLNMPRMAGLEATAHLKRDPATRDIPVIVVTAHAHPAQRDSALEAGASEVLIKPINLMALGETLSRYLRREEKATIPPETNTKDRNTVKFENFALTC